MPFARNSYFLVSFWNTPDVLISMNTGISGMGAATVPTFTGRVTLALALTFQEMMAYTSFTSTFNSGNQWPPMLECLAS
ncbi:hypothetical protein D3C72_1798710 [compost metagenome]